MPTRFPFLPLCGLVLCRAAASACAAEASATDPLPPPAAERAPDDAAIAFDLPALPLADALKRYAALTRQPALFRSEILAGRTSSAVRGRYAPDAALRLLLEGTGLVAEQVRTGSGPTLALKPAEPAAAPPPRAASLGSLAGYPGLVQARVWQALCDDPRTRPGAYRSLLRFEVDATGRLQRPRLLGSSGDAARDAAMLRALEAVRLAEAPPPGMPQPLTLLVRPTPPGGDPECRDAADSPAESPAD